MTNPKLLNRVIGTIRCVFTVSRIFTMSLFSQLGPRPTPASSSPRRDLDNLDPRRRRKFAQCVLSWFARRSDRLSFQQTCYLIVRIMRWQFVFSTMLRLNLLLLHTNFRKLWVLFGALLIGGLLSLSIFRDEDERSPTWEKIR